MHQLLYLTSKNNLSMLGLNNGITQEEIAHIIGTSKFSISRLESLNNIFMPNVGTLIKYAEVLGLKLNMGLNLSIVNCRKDY